MSGVAYIATKHVRHVAAWTATHRKDGHHHYWTEGRFRAICGRQTHKDAVLAWDVALILTESNEQWIDRIKTALRLPVCKDCRGVAETLAALAEDRTEHLGALR